MSHSRREFLEFTAAGLLLGPRLLFAESAGSTRQEPVVGQNGMVVSVSREASEAGLAILKNGGNAVDAAIATASALAVTHPPAGNIGGGGFMLVAPRGAERPTMVDYREVAPAAATRTMYSPGDSVHNHKAVGVPGTVRGLQLAHKKFGSRPWKELVTPAVQLAREGFPIDDSLANSLNGVLKNSPQFAELQRVFAPPENRPAWKEGDRLVQPELAATLELIAEEGPDAFYTGRIADQLAAEMEAGGGIITKADLAAYEAKIRVPIHGTFRGYDVFGPAPPSSGGITLVQMLNVLETFNLRELGRWSPETMHLMAETMRRAYANRARYLGDPDFVEIPDFLTSKTYARELAESIDRKRATPSEEIAADIRLTAESDSTTHFSVIDAQGMAVSNTYTLEQSYGSRVVVRGAGFLLNNEMGDFNWFPGVTTRRGRIGTDPNLIAPGKRMLSSMTPTLVFREGKPVLVTGSPGGRTIINTVLCVLLNALEFEMGIRAAVDAPRLHHQWFPDELRFEGIEQHAEAVKQLRAMGHTVKPAKQGDAHSIAITQGPKRYLGAADHRIDGFAAAY